MLTKLENGIISLCGYHRKPSCAKIWAARILFADLRRSHIFCKFIVWQAEEIIGQTRLNMDCGSGSFYSDPDPHLEKGQIRSRSQHPESKSRKNQAVLSLYIDRRYGEVPLSQLYRILNWQRKKSA